MCVIMCVPAGVEMPEGWIEKAIEKNPDWWGMSFKDDRGLHVRRGFSVRSAKRAWRRAPLDTERIFHARIGTSGIKDIRNTHPFDCGQNGGPRRLLFHNGTVSVPLVKREFCDTWHLAQALRIGDDKEIQEALTAYAFSEHSRFAVQSELPAQDTLLYGKWEKKNGIHLSNTFFLPYTPTTYGGGSNGYRESYGPYSTKFKTWDGKRGVWVEHTMPAEDADDEELTAFFKRIDMEEDAAAADEAALALLPRGTHSERRIEAQMDIAADASMLYNPEDQDIVYERVYNRLHAMTDAEFLEAETNCGYGVHALEGMVDDAWQWVDDTEYQPLVAEEKV